jgi:hypothetical protein
MSIIEAAFWVDPFQTHYFKITNVRWLLSCKHYKTNNNYLKPYHKLFYNDGLYSWVVNGLREEYYASVFKAIYIKHWGNRFFRNVGNQLRDYIFPLGNEENHENLSQNRRCPGQVPRECKSRTFYRNTNSSVLLLFSSPLSLLLLRRIYF